MRILLFAAASIVAAAAVAQDDRRPNPLDAKAKAPAVQYRSAFEGYQPFSEQELRDWRKSNAEVGAAGGHAGHKPGQGAGAQTSKPEPGKAETSGQHRHGAHK